MSVDVKVDSAVDYYLQRMILLNKKIIMQAKHYNYQGVLEETLRQIEETLFAVTGEEIVVNNNSNLIL